MGLTSVQSGRLADLLAETLPRNRFYAAKFAHTRGADATPLADPVHLIMPTRLTWELSGQTGQ